MSILLAILLAVLPLQTTELYNDYITPETQEMLDKFDQLEQDLQEAEDARQEQKTMALVFSIVIGLIPLFYIGRQAVKAGTWKNNPAGTAKGLGIGLLGGLVLFGLNYGIFTLKFKMGDAFNTTLAFVLVAAIIVGAVWLLTKKDNNSKN